MLNFLKNLFLGEPTPPHHGGLGVILNTPDNRDIATAMIRPNISRETLPDSIITDISMIPVMNQGFLGTCVAHALVTIKQWLDFKETGKIVSLSRRFLYSLSRVKAGLEETDGQGLPPRVAAKVLCDVGTTDDDSIDNNNLNHIDYCSLIISPEMAQNAKIYMTKGYAFCDMTAEGLMQDIAHFGLITATIAYDSSTWLQAFIRKVKQIMGWHQIVIYGYKKEGEDTRFFWRNSWGKLWGSYGDGEFLWSEYKNYMYDPMVFTDLPNDLVERAKQTQFIFLRDLKFGSFGEDVVKLQKRMRDYGYFKHPFNTGFFASVTKESVIRYQHDHGLVGDGVVGPKTRASLNEMVQINTSKSKIDVWCEAIKEKEGWHPPGSHYYPAGSRSFRNNNPGNLRYVGQAKATGQDYSGFCIFKTYEDGYMSLRKMLVNACTGHSKVYNPEMTLYEFYNKYAPSNDGNDPNNYAEFVASKLGVEPSIKIKELL